MAASSRPTRPARTWPAIVLPLAATLVVYWPTLGYGFLLDDHALYESSASLDDMGSVARGFATDVGSIRKGTETAISSYYRPVYLALSTLYHQAGGGAPSAWHLAAVALGGLIGALACLLLLRLGLAPPLAALASTVFALHPSHVSSIAWVSGLQELLAAAFALLSVLALLRPLPRARDRAAPALAALFFTLAVLSKEVALGLLPLTVIWAFVEQRGERGARLRRTALALGAVALAYLGVRWAIFGALAQPAPGAPTAAQAVASLPLAAVTYLRLLVWPTGFSILRPERPVAAMLSGPTAVYVAVLLVAGSFAAALVRRRREFALPWAWLVCFLAPVLNLWVLPAQWMVTDRYLFLPSLALPWMVALVPSRRVSLGVLGAMALVFGGLTLRYHAIFRNEGAFLAAMERAEPTSALVFAEKGRLLREKGSLDAARVALERAVELDPLAPAALISLADLELGHGELDRAETHYRAALAVRPYASRGFKLLTLARAQAGQREAALELSEESARRWPDDFEIALMRALLLAESGDRAGAERAFANARLIRPHDPAVAGGIDDALAQLAARIRPRPR